MQNHGKFKTFFMTSFICSLAILFDRSLVVPKGVIYKKFGENRRLSFWDITNYVIFTFLVHVTLTLDLWRSNFVFRLFVGLRIRQNGQYLYDLPGKCTFALLWKLTFYDVTKTFEHDVIEQIWWRRQISPSRLVLCAKIRILLACFIPKLSRKMS